MLETLIQKLAADPKTTVTGIVGAIVTLVAAFGFQVSADVQTAIITLSVLALALVSRDTKVIPPPPAE